MSFTESPAYAQLKSVFKGELVLPSDAEYKDSLKRWSVLAERQAGAVAYVKDEEDVAAAVKFAVEAKLEIAIKGGGHNPSGASSTNGGIVIDLSKHLNKVTVDMDLKIARVQGGALWSDVDEATCSLGLATVGGTVSETGVGGYILQYLYIFTDYRLTVGGGYGFLTGRHGLTIDNLVSATVVVADGQILQANKQENPDLFWAIRGGGSNFGIVTKFQLALHPIPAVCWSGNLIFTLDKLEALVQAGVEWREKIMSVDDSALMGLTQSPRDGSQMLLVTCVHLGPEEAGKKQYKLFYDVGPMMDMTLERSYLQVNRELDKMVPRGKAYFSAGATILKPDLQVFKDVLAIQAEFRAQIPQARHMVGFELYPTAKIQEIGNDAMAFSCRGPQSNVIINVNWSADDVDKVDVGEVRKKVKEIVSAIQGGQSESEPTYGNYEGDQVLVEVKVRNLFGGNYRKLQTIKAKYDPDLVFGKWFLIQPLA